MCFLPKHGVILDFRGFGEPSSRGSVASNGIQTRTPTTWKWPPRLGDRCPPFPEKHPDGLTKSAPPWFFRCVFVSYIENGGSFLHCHVFFWSVNLVTFVVDCSFWREVLDSWRMFRSFSGSNHREIGISKSEGRYLQGFFKLPCLHLDGAKSVRTRKQAFKF